MEPKVHNHDNRVTPLAPVLGQFSAVHNV